ncbi:hypothetical protein ACFL4N_00450 [Thermodesulfobacteriota bacterium]
MVNAYFLLLKKLNIEKPYKMTCPAAGGQTIKRYGHIAGLCALGFGSAKKG